jgi:hypothetical protein
MWWLNSWRFQKKPSIAASNNGRINGAKVCVHAFPPTEHYMLDDYFNQTFITYLHYIHLLFCSPSFPYICVCAFFLFTVIILL